MPRVSIVMTAVNEDEALPETLDSILSQSFGAFELVIVDDGSTDGSVEICRAAAARDARVSVFENAVNVGPIQNFHRCLWRATGEYVRLHSADGPAP